jgi:hypothetical protein
VIAYRVTLDVPREPVQCVAALLAEERRRRGTPRGSRALTCLWQAVLGLRWFRDRTGADALARDHGVSRATAYRYLDEVVLVLAGQAPELGEALQRASEEGFSHVILDGTVIACDRCKEPAVSVKGQVIDAWYSGKAHTHGGNVQAVTAPDGFPLWVSEAEPGSVHDLTAARGGAPPQRRALRCTTSAPRAAVHDLTAARAHALPALYRAAATACPPWPTPATRAPESASSSQSGSRPAARTSTSTAGPATPSNVPCAASGNAGSPCSQAAGAPSSTSLPDPAKSAPSPAPPSS